MEDSTAPQSMKLSSSQWGFLSRNFAVKTPQILHIAETFQQVLPQ